ncbi:MAG: undecaprenyl-diphosphate phosphatase [Actinomycetia bacterium]|nr:undecaprenyl-diphosphate phosphatase [Actinomycetes bacterium]
MSLLYAIVTGIVQGLTEYLPVSSTGHLAIINLIFGRKVGGGDPFIIWLHGATLMALLVYFWRDIVDLIRCWAPSHQRDMARERRIFIFIILATIVTGIMGLIYQKLDLADGSFLMLGLGYVVTTLLLILAERLGSRASRRSIDRLGSGRALGVGFAQGLGLIASISRSGSTIAGGLFSGLDREQATRFAFLAGIPAIAAAFLLDLLGLGHLPADWNWLAAGLAFVLAAAVAYLSIGWLLALVKRVRLYGFAAYTGLLAVVLLILAALKVKI